MGCASSMAVQASTSNVNNDYLTYRRRTPSRPDPSQFGKHIVMAIIRDKTKRKSTDGNFVHGGYVKTNSMYGPRKRTEDDFKFIEQREIDNDSPCTETTILSSESDATTSTVRSRRLNGKTVLVKPAPESVATGLPSAFTQNYERRLAILRGTAPPVSVIPVVNVTPKQPDIQPEGPRQRRKVIEESPRMEIVHHISREEYIKSVQSVPKTDPPTQPMPPAPPISIVHAKPLPSAKDRKKRDRNDSVASTGQDSVSENSYVVTHNTLNITWEHDYHRRVNNKKCLPLDTDSIDTVTQLRDISIAESDEIQCLD
uniref:Uncharacterized protein n=1 Tax=Panagrellus redivivus TaxID=6233 RepID=A0A7E4UYC9_PANRE